MMKCLKWVLSMILPVFGVMAFAQDVKEAAPKDKWLTYSNNLRSDPSLVLYYNFEQEAKGATITNKASGEDIEGYTAEELDGSITKGTWVEGRWPGKGALHFEGDGYLQFRNTAVMKGVLQSRGSMEMWLKPDSVWSAGKNRFLFDAGGYPQWVLYKSATEDGLEFYIGSPGVPMFSTPGWGWQAEKWYHIAITWDNAGSGENSGETWFYVNGKQIGDEWGRHKGKNISTPALRDSTRIAGGTGLEGVDGTVDEVAVYNRVLSKDEFEQHYRMGKPTLVAAAAGHMGKPASAAAAEATEVALPAFWQVKLDPGDVGVKEKWFDSGLDEQGWQPISTHKWVGWDKQGMPEHEGFGWYRVGGWLPDTLRRKFTYLYFSAVDEGAWLWVNGQAAGEHTCASENLTPNDIWNKPFFLEITRYVLFEKPNQFTVRVHNSGKMGGIHKPTYLFTSDAPLSLAQMNERADVLNEKILEAREDTVRYQAWTGYAYDPVFPDSKAPKQTDAEKQPPPRGSWARNLAGTIHVAGASGELVPLVVHVRNHGKAPLPLRLDFQGVRHDQRPRFVLGGDRVDVHLVDYVVTRAKDLVPDPLPRAGGANNVQIAPNETRTFFATIDTGGLPAGLWKGALRLTPLRTDPALEIPFELEVASAVLPEVMPIWINMWTYVPRWECSQRGRGDDERYLELMLRTGVNTVLTRSYGMFWPIYNDAGDLVSMHTLDFDQLLASQKYNSEKFLIVGILPDGHRTFKCGEDSPIENRNFIKYVKMIARHVRENHGVPYDRWALYLADESMGDDFLPYAKLTREADPKIRIWANPQSLEDLEVVRKAEPYVDIFVPCRWHIGAHPASEELMRQKEWWMYAHSGFQPPDNLAVPRNDVYSAHRKLRMDGWMAWKLGLKGFGYWLYIGDFWGRYSGLDEMDGANLGFVYMGQDGPVTSRRLEAYREGLEDYKLLWLIDRAAQAEGQNPALVKQARGHIDTAVKEVMAGPREGETLLRWRGTLLKDAEKLCAALPLEVKATVTAGRDSATLELNASEPVRVWAWLRQGGTRPPLEERNWRLVESSTAASTAPTLMIKDLIPGQPCLVTLVIAGPEGQQKVLAQEFVTEGW